MVNNIMAAMKTSGSTKASQSQKSKRSASDDKSAFNQALSDAAGAAKQTDSQTVDKKDYDKKDTSAAKDSTEAVQETTGEQGNPASEKVIGQDVFASTMQMGAESPQAAGEMQAAFNQALTDADGNPELLHEDMIGNLGGVTQIGTDAGEVSDGGLVSGEISAELMGQNVQPETVKAQTDSEFSDQMASMNNGAKTAGGENAGKDETDIVDVRAEAAADRAGLSYARVQGNAGEATSVQAEVQVTESGDIREEYADMLKDIIARQIAGGKTELEISLTPRHLGELLVKVAYEAGETTISIICTNERAMQAMSSRASELGKTLETTLGDKMNVVVEQKEQNGSQLYEDGRSGSGAQAQKEELEKREAEMRRRLEKEAGSADFLHQLRLGLA